jgi:hypothetical protein
LIEIENRTILEQFTECKKSVGGENRIKIMLGLIDYLEKVEWMEGIQTKLKSFFKKLHMDFIILNILLINWKMYLTI